MIHQTLVVGPFQCNCVILGCERTKEGVLIDPGDSGDKILDEVKRLGLDIKYILHTHAHLDHIGATATVRAAINAPTCLHAGDELLYQNLPMQGQMFGLRTGQTPPLEKKLEDLEELKFGDYAFRVLHTPGHSPGGVCFQMMSGSEDVFSGDTLFYRSIGRADLWGADGDLLIQSIKTRLLTLDGDTPVHPGHGPSTRLGDEKLENPFLI